MCVIFSTNVILPWSHLSVIFYYFHKCLSVDHNQESLRYETDHNFYACFYFKIREWSVQLNSVHGFWYLDVSWCSVHAVHIKKLWQFDVKHQIIAGFLLETGSPKLWYCNVDLFPNHLSSYREVKHHIGEGDILWSSTIIAI